MNSFVLIARLIQFACLFGFFLGYYYGLDPLWHSVILSIVMIVVTCALFRKTEKPAGNEAKNTIIEGLPIMMMIAMMIITLEPFKSDQISIWFGMIVVVTCYIFTLLRFGSGFI